MKELTWEEYNPMLNGWNEDKTEYIKRVPEGHVLVMTSVGKYYLKKKESHPIPKVIKKAKK